MISTSLLVYDFSNRSMVPVWKMLISPSYNTRRISWRLMCWQKIIDLPAIGAGFSFYFYLSFYFSFSLFLSFYRYLINSRSLSFSFSLSLSYSTGAAIIAKASLSFHSYLTFVSPSTYRLILCTTVMYRVFPKLYVSTKCGSPVAPTTLSPQDAELSLDLLRCSFVNTMSQKLSYVSRLVSTLITQICETDSTA